MTLRKKLSKGLIISIICATISVAAAVSLIITNIFIPVKYLYAYINFNTTQAEAGALTVHFISVGYGDCTLIEFPDGKTALIDAGDGRWSNEQAVLKFLNSRKIDTVDYLICSSVNPKRCGGLAEIIKYKTVGEIYLPYGVASQINAAYRRFVNAVNSSISQPQFCEYGAGACTEDYFLGFLSPSAHTLEGDEESLEAETVIWLEYAGVSFLFSGDVSDTVAVKLIEDAAIGGLEMNGRKINLQSCNVLKIGSNGAAVSGSNVLYDICKPQAAIISVGENARGCPSAATIANAQHFVGDKLYRTDLCGTVTVTAKDGKFTVSGQKSNF